MMVTVEGVGSRVVQADMKSLSAKVPVMKIGGAEFFVIMLSLISNIGN